MRQFQVLKFFFFFHKWSTYIDDIHGSVELFLTCVSNISDYEKPRHDCFDSYPEDVCGFAVCTLQEFALNCRRTCGLCAGKNIFMKEKNTN